MKSYFTIAQRVGPYRKRQWYVDKYPYNGPFYKVHAAMGLIFTSEDECEREILERIKTEGGCIISPPKRNNSYVKESIRRTKNYNKNVSVQAKKSRRINRSN